MLIAIHPGHGFIAFGKKAVLPHVVDDLIHREFYGQWPGEFLAKNSFGTLLEKCFVALLFFLQCLYLSLGWSLVNSGHLKIGMLGMDETGSKKLYEEDIASMILVPVIAVELAGVGRYGLLKKTDAAFFRKKNSEN